MAATNYDLHDAWDVSSHQSATAEPDERVQVTCADDIFALIFCQPVKKAPPMKLMLARAARAKTPVWIHVRLQAPSATCHIAPASTEGKFKSAPHSILHRDRNGAARRKAHLIGDLNLTPDCLFKKQVYDVGHAAAVAKIDSIAADFLGVGGIFHGAIEVFHKEWSFGGTKKSKSGIFPSPPKGCKMHTYRESVYMVSMHSHQPRRAHRGAT